MICWLLLVGVHAKMGTDTNEKKMICAQMTLFEDERKKEDPISAKRPAEKRKSRIAATFGAFRCKLVQFGALTRTRDRAVGCLQLDRPL